MPANRRGVASDLERRWRWLRRDDRRNPRRKSRVERRKERVNVSIARRLLHQRFDRAVIDRFRFVADVCEGIDHPAIARMHVDDGSRHAIVCGYEIIPGVEDPIAKRDHRNLRDRRRRVLVEDEAHPENSRARVARDDDSPREEIHTSVDDVNKHDLQSEVGSGERGLDDWCVRLGISLHVRKRRIAKPHQRRPRGGRDEQAHVRAHAVVSAEVRSRADVELFPERYAS